jgi:5-hydroxyisourate hydrolase-like protein (transthyretin family)
VTLASATAPMSRVTDTDVTGAYRFDQLAPGGYRITVEKPGFVTLTADAVPKATLRMTRGGAIEGVVRDVTGDPLWNVAVTAVLQREGDKPRNVAQVRTDDLGRYRLHSLPEGDYFVQAATDPGFLQRAFLVLMPGEKRPEPQRVFFPAASRLEDAELVQLLAGRAVTAVDVTLPLSAPIADPAAAPERPRPDATGTARIGGRVIDALSGKPIAKAQLLLVPVEGQRLTNWTRTDTDGRFVYSALQARRYALRAQADRYVSWEFGQMQAGATGMQIQLRDGEDFVADMKLPRATAIEGTLLDEFGDPAPGIVLQVARKTYAAGRHRLMPIGGPLQRAVTDDRGHYRVSALPPGDYYVIGLSGAYSDLNEVGGFAPTYYPGTIDTGAAVPVSLSVAADSTAAFSLVPAKMVTISGTMVDAQGAPVTGRGTLWLVTPDRLQRMDFHIARGSTTSDGRFTLRNVPQGSYTMQGFGPAPAGDREPGNLGAMTFGWLPITTGETDITNALLRVTGGTSLRGRIVLDDSQTPPPTGQQVRVTAIPVEFDSAPVAGAPPPSETRDDLTFEVTRLSGVRRILASVSLPGWAVKRITVNDVDVTDVPVDLRTKDVENVEVVLTSKVSRITGAVSDDKGAIADYAVIVFPSDATKWIDRSRFIAMARPTQNGQFEVRALPPEEYLIVALPAVRDNEWQDPEVLLRLRPHATRFTLREGEARTFDLKIKARP